MADIVLKDRNGRDVQYPGVNYLKVNTVDGGTQGFAAYDPETLKAENLPVGVTVGDVEGALEVPQILENVPVALDFSSGGNMEFAAPDGYAVKSAVVQKPANLLPGNIAKDVDIAGVVGTLESGGGSGTYIVYTLDESGNIIGATPYGFTKITDYAFYGLSKLEWVDLSNCPNISSIGQYAFGNCSALKITIPDTVTSIEKWAFSNTALESITIPASVTSIGENAFYNSTKLTNVTIDAPLTTLPYAMFRGCKMLEIVNIPDTVTTINQYAFGDCSALTNITIPASVTRVVKQAFYGAGLTSAIFEDTTTWYRTNTSGATSGGTSVSVTNASTAATYLTTTYASYHWYKL